VKIGPTGGGSGFGGDAMPGVENLGFWYPEDWTNNIACIDLRELQEFTYYIF
jgi:hypothetical protein